MRWKRGKRCTQGWDWSGGLRGEEPAAARDWTCPLGSCHGVGLSSQVKEIPGKRDGLRISVWMCLRVEMDDGFGISVTGNQKGTKEDTSLGYSWD